MELILWIISGLVIAGGALTALRGSGSVMAFSVALRDQSVRRRQADDQRALVEAVATWTENLRDTIFASSGLEQAIIATELHAPRAISVPVRRLVASLRYGSLEDGLRRFADDVSHPTCDFVVAALITTARSRVVLPDPVPPATIMFFLLRTAAARKLPTSGSIICRSTSCEIAENSKRCRRITSVG